MKREEILAFFASNPEVLAYVLSLESQIKELTERLQTLEARLNQNSRNNSRPPSTDFFAKEKPICIRLRILLTQNWLLIF